MPIHAETTWRTARLWDDDLPTANRNLDPAARLETIRAELGPCTRCRLHGARTQIVFGTGPPDARLLVAGEVPGAHEDAAGIPFNGPSGRLLDRMLAAIGVRREDAYLCNVIKCRPAGDRDPERDEIDTCAPFLHAQVDSVAPEVVLAVGGVAARTLLGDQRTPISKLRGRTYRYRDALLVPTWPPAFLLRRPDFKGQAWQDLKLVRTLLDRAERAATCEETPLQPPAGGGAPADG